MKNLIVQKYGGTSVGTPEKIKAVAKRIASSYKTGKNLVVVVSAMGQTTDELIDLAQKISPNHPEVRHEREMDMLLTTGERVSMALLSMALQDLNVPAISFTGSQAGILTDASHSKARILDIKPIRILKELKKRKVVIVAGFQGVSPNKEITTLGRGGSDTTAVALAASLKASFCEILTDVPGIFSADPRLIPTAIRYEVLPLDLVLEMAFLGSQVMHPRAIEIARETGFPIYVGLSHLKKPRDFSTKALQKSGTMILPQSKRKNAALELPKVVALSVKKELCILEIQSKDSTRFLKHCKEFSVLFYGILQDEKKLSLLISESESQKLTQRFNVRVKKSKKVALLSLIGYQMAGRPEVMEVLVSILTKNRVKVLGLTSQAQSITVWINEQSLKPELLRELHDQMI